MLLATCWFPRYTAANPAEAGKVLPSADNAPDQEAIFTALLHINPQHPPVVSALFCIVQVGGVVS